MRALHRAGVNQAEQGRVQCLRHGQVHARREAGLLAVQRLKQRTAAEALQRVRGVHRRAKQDDGVAGVLKPRGGDVFRLLDEADDGDGRRGVNCTERPALVIERDIAAGDRRVEGAAALCQTAHGFLELPENLRVVRVAEVEVVRRAERGGPGTREVAASLGDSGLPAFVRVEIDVNPVAVASEGDVFVGHWRTGGSGLASLRCRIFGLRDGQAVALDADDCRVAAGANDGAVTDHVIVLAIDPVLRGDGVVGEELLEVARRVRRVGDAIEAEGPHRFHVGRFFRLALINRRFVRELLRRHVHDDVAAVAHDHPARVRHDADLGPR